MKNRKVKESELQKLILDYLKAKNIFHYRNNSGAFKNSEGHFYRFGANGSPDIVIVKNGQYIGCEIKGTGGLQSQYQKDFQEGLEKAGGKYLLIYSLEELIKYGII